MAQVLEGSWRSSPRPPVCSPEELAEIELLLLKQGAGGLAWARLRDSDLGRSPVAYRFQQAYRMQSLEAALHERSLKKIIPILRNAGVEPLVVKGWAIARFYPVPGFRPYCDLDLCVLPEHYSAAQAVLKSPEAASCGVDLHLGFGKFYEGRTDDIFARSRLAALDGLEVRVLSPEDDLRFICLHLLRHGAIRPLWLCDVGVLLEARSPEFDWDSCLSGRRREMNWIACAIGLASLLLGVDIEGVPVSDRIGTLPTWMIPAVLKGWGTPFETPRQVVTFLRHPIGLLKELTHHWPNPIEATMTVGGPFNDVPRLPFQVGHVVSRAGALVSQLSREQRREPITRN